MKLDRFPVPHEYLDVFRRAFLTFKFQIVYCPKRNEFVHLNKLEIHPLRTALAEYQDTSFLGRILEHEEALKIVRGEKNPRSLVDYELDPDKLFEIEGIALKSRAE